MDFTPDQLERFHLLRGKVSIWQGKEGLRTGSDAVLLSAVPYRAQNVLELGCGVGGAALCYAYRETDAKIIGVEQHTGWAALAEKNIAENVMSDRMQVICADFRDKILLKKVGLTSDSQDLVIMNPPYYDANAFTPPQSQERSLTHTEDAKLKEWIDCGLRFLRQFALLAIIHRPERLPEILNTLDGRAGDIAILPIYSRSAQPAKRVIVYAFKSRKGKMRLLQGLTMHDASGYGEAAKGILEDAEAMPITLSFTSRL